MKERKLVCVRDVMGTQFDIVDGLMTVHDALKTMKHGATKQLIVKKRHAHDEYGMVAFADIAKKVLAKDRAPERVNIYEVMEKPVLTVHPDMDIRYCARLLERFNLFYAPVVQKGEVIGIVTLTGMVMHGIIDRL
jgi:CBS domain-containing protein